MQLRPVGDYHTGVVTNSVYGISTVEARGGPYGLSIYGDPVFRLGPPGARSQQPAARVPKVPRNRPCPCGGGKKFKFCHAR